MQFEVLSIYYFQCKGINFHTEYILCNIPTDLRCCKDLCRFLLVVNSYQIAFIRSRCVITDIIPPFWFIQLFFFLCAFCSGSITLTTTTSSLSSYLVPLCWRNLQERSWASTSVGARLHSWESLYPRCVCVCVALMLSIAFSFSKISTLWFLIFLCLLAGGPRLRCPQGRATRGRPGSLCEWSRFPRHRAFKSKLEQAEIHTDFNQYIFIQCTSM